jgi:hypothetical protein
MKATVEVHGCSSVHGISRRIELNEKVAAALVGADYAAEVEIEMIDSTGPEYLRVWVDEWHTSIAADLVSRMGRVGLRVQLARMRQFFTSVPVSVPGAEASDPHGLAHLDQRRTPQEMKGAHMGDNALVDDR